MWLLINEFLSDIATAQNYPREELSMIVEQRKDGPTIGPGSGSTEKGNIVMSVEAGMTAPKNFPPIWYDSIRYTHLDFKVIRTQPGKVPVPVTLYHFQHAPFFGNCRICIQRWVRVHDPKKWSAALNKKALQFRARLASGPASCSLLVVSTGASFSGDEQYKSFEQVYSGHSRKIAVLDLSKYLGAKA